MLCTYSNLKVKVLAHGYLTCLQCGSRSCPPLSTSKVIFFLNLFCNPIIGQLQQWHFIRGRSWDKLISFEKKERKEKKTKKQNLSLRIIWNMIFLRRRRSIESFSSISSFKNVFFYFFCEFIKTTKWLMLSFKTSFKY